MKIFLRSLYRLTFLTHFKNSVRVTLYVDGLVIWQNTLGQEFLNYIWQNWYGMEILFIRMKSLYILISLVYFWNSIFIGIFKILQTYWKYLRIFKRWTLSIIPFVDKCCFMPNTRKILHLCQSRSCMPPSFAYGCNYALELCIQF